MLPRVSEEWHLKRGVCGKDSIFPYGKCGIPGTLSAGVLFAGGGRSALAVRRVGAAANCATRRVVNIHMRQPTPRQERFRKKGGRGDGALKIGERFR